MQSRQKPSSDQRLKKQTVERYYGIVCYYSSKNLGGKRLPCSQVTIHKNTVSPTHPKSFGGDGRRCCDSPVVVFGVLWLRATLCIRYNEWTTLRGLASADGGDGGVEKVAWGGRREWSWGRWIEWFDWSQEEVFINATTILETFEKKDLGQIRLVRVPSGIF